MSAGEDPSTGERISQRESGPTSRAPGPCREGGVPRGREDPTSPPRTRTS
ncbi:hypothetical protein HBB16_05060 [Pseudonocardia sp. MCCB 268]|nr:hypothetical protein [Pseudonocardia cytotoxica]